jgi:hypothetical protein
LKDHKGSITSELYDIKNCKAAGINTKYEKPRLIKNKTVDPIKSGKINFLSPAFKPGITKKVN